MTNIWILKKFQFLTEEIYYSVVLAAICSFTMLIFIFIELFQNAWSGGYIAGTSVGNLVNGRSQLDRKMKVS